MRLRKSEIGFLIALDLRGEAEQDRARAQVRLILQTLGHALGEALDEKVDLGGNHADVVGLLVGGLEGRAPDEPALRLVEVGEILREADDQIHLGEDGVDGKVDLQFFVQFVEPLADGVGVRVHLRRREVENVRDADRHDARR